MTKTKSTKRALLMSALALLMCVSMLIGSTFAWFTDEVTSAGNVITSGTLDVDLVDENGDSLAGQVIEFVAADGRAQHEILWEPGCTYKTEPFHVVNKGNLALNYKLGINGIIGDAKLLEAIEWTVTVGGVSTSLNALNGSLLAGEESGEIVLIGHMKEDAGNEYQGLTVENISITVFATQMTKENDSINDQYDKMATVDDVAELNAALADDYDLITLGADIVLTETLEIANGKEVTIDLAGYAISGVDTTSLYSLIHVNNGGSLTVKDSVGTGKITYDAGSGNKTGTAVWNEGALVLESGTIEITGEWSIGFAVDVRPNAWGSNYTEPATFTMNGGALVASDSGVRVNVNSGSGDADTAAFIMNNGKINSAYDAIFAQHNYAGKADVLVKDGILTSGTHAVRIYGDFSTNMDITINGGKFIGKLTNLENTGSGKSSITGGTFSVDPSAFVVDGKKAVQVGDMYEIIDSTTTYATASTAAELQAALNNAANVNLIVLTADIEGDVTAKQIADLDITINGDGHKYEGVILIDGNSATETTSSITLKNINFVADSVSADACVQLGNGTTNTRYTCNVTVDNCTFDVPGVVGVKSYTGGDKNLTITNCTATARAHSLAQLKGIDGVLVDNCKVYSIRGISFNNSLNVTVKDSTIDVQKYAVRFGDDENNTVENYEIINSTIVSENVDDDAAIVLRAGATNANLTITNTTITARVQMAGHENANLTIN